MATILTPPARPAELWQSRVDEWVAAVEELMTTTEQWIANRDWASRRDMKEITEEGLGTYEIPVMLIQSPQGRLILDPRGRNTFGADGRIDFCVFPSYDWYFLIREGKRWRLYPGSRNKDGRDWNEATFVDAAKELLKRA